MLKHLAPLLLGISIAFIPALAVAASDSAPISFLLKQAHDRGITQCDAGIRDTFKLAAGADAANVRVVTDRVPGQDAVKITAVYSQAEISTITDAVIIKAGGKCFIFTTSTVSASESCTAYAAQSPEFTFESEINGVVLTRNKGGAWMILQPVSSGCSVHYKSDNLY